MLSMLQEKRPLKRTRLGPPDIYPQDAKQREDELTPTNVKHGFTTTPPLSDEFGTAHNSNVNASKVSAFFSGVLAKKEELMTLPDTGRKKQQINCKDNFWPVSPRRKCTVDAWFKDLAGNKPLLSLAKRAPSFNKKEEIFITLCENQVNMQRATWFIKLSAAYTLSFTESKNKKRSIYDPAAEWTGNMIKFMKELLPKLQEYYQQSHDKSTSNGITSGSLTAAGNGSASNGNSGTTSINSVTGSNAPTNVIPVPSMASPLPPIHSPANGQQGTPGGGVNSVSVMPTTGSLGGVVGGSGSSVVGGPAGAGAAVPPGSTISGIGSQFEDSRNALKYWKYCHQLSKYMYEESLLDRQEFLNWILDLLDKMRTQASFDEPLKKLVLSFALQYMHDFVQSERLCRKMAYIVSKKLDQLLNTVVEQQNIKGLDEQKLQQVHYELALQEQMSCPHHRDIVLYLSTILQIITIECPTALVWSGIAAHRAPSSLLGSPLDHLPLAPSVLPMPTRCPRTNQEIRRQLRSAESDIVLRTQHAEQRWFAAKWLSAGKNQYTSVLATLDHLDTHCFDRMEHNNSIDTLYAQIFPSPSASRRREDDQVEPRPSYEPKQDKDTVRILCEWAVSGQRWGEHRAMVVAILLDKRQIDVTSTPADQQSSDKDDKDSLASGAGLIDGLPVFQHVLMHFLDHDAPVLDEHVSSPQQRTEFTNLVQLFSALIRHDVFSHNAYMHTLISRGDLLLESVLVMKSGTTATKTSPPPPAPPPTTTHGFDDDGFGGGLDFKHNEFDDSNVDDDLDKLVQNIKEKGQQHEAPDSPKIGPPGDGETNPGGSISRHYVYTKHFPIPQDDPSMSSYSSESNQRYILLFGVGKERDEKKHAVKKMSKEIGKLFTKKFSIDVAAAGHVKKHSRNEFNFEATTSKCQQMAYFDQHVVTAQCAANVLEQLNGFALGNNNYLPVQEHVAFLFDLMELALNIYSLLELCDSLLKELPEVEHQLQLKKSNLVRSYTTSLALYIVSILRRYHSCLLLSPEQTLSVFEGVCRTIRHVSNPSECTSAERCIIAYLSDLHESCVLLQGKEQSTEYYQQLQCIKRFKDIFNTPEQLGLPPQGYNPQLLQELFMAPRRGGKLDPHWLGTLHESPANVYSFVSNALIAVCRETDNERLNDVALACAELTASCNVLSEEWIYALQSLCSGSKSPRYPHLGGQVDIGQVKTHNALAVFVCILVARHCFSLADFVSKFALPTLARSVSAGGAELSVDAEAGARLTCHLVLKLFKTLEIPQPGMYSVSTSPNPLHAVGNDFSIRLSCDRHLLVGAHKTIPIAAVLAVLKAILIVVDNAALKTPLASGSGSSSGGLGGAFGSGKRSGFNTPVHPGSTPKSNEQRPADLSQILGTSDLQLGSSLTSEPEALQQPSVGGMEQISLLEFAQAVLKQICAQEHVLERCLKNAEQLCDMIIDEMLTAKQAQRVLHMICYPESEFNIISELDQRSMIVRILENLGQWTLRISWLDLQLMYRQSLSNNAELNVWLDTVARAAIDVFHMEEVVLPGAVKATHKPKPSTWLVAPLIAKLTPAVQGRILRVAGQVLESMNYFSKVPKSDCNSSGSGDEREKSNSCHSSNSYGLGGAPARNKKMPLNYQPFLGLILTCLKGQDEYKENLLVSLYAQLSQCLQSFAELDTIGGVDEPQAREEILDALQLRFSLVGGMFEAIQKNSTPTTDWAILLAQLVCQGVVDLSCNRELFTTVVDMLATLVHSTLVSDDERHYMNLMKKLKKEIGEKNNASIRVIRQLLPLYKQPTEVIACEHSGMDTKGNKICDIDKKQLRISDKQRISVWDILEGHKNPAPLSWVWFGAVKLERKPLTYEEAHRNLKYHTHSLVKPSSYYYEPLPLPPEDIEPVPEKICIKDEMKADTPSSVDQSPSAVVGGTGRGRGKGTTTRKRKPKNPKTPPVVNTQQQQPQLAPQPQQPQNVQQQQMQQQQQQQQHMQQQQMQPNQMSQMPMNMPMNMQQFAPNPNSMMQQNAMLQQQQQMQQMGNNPLQQQLNVGGGNGQQNPQMNFMQQGPGGGGAGPQGMPGQQQQWHNAPQQQQPPQPYHNQYAPHQQNMQSNRIERPPLNANSKQALSQMLRQRQPFQQQQAQQGPGGGFNPMQQQPQPSQQQPGPQQQINPNQMRQQQMNPQQNPQSVAAFNAMQQQQQNAQQQQMNPNQQQQQQFMRGGNMRPGMAPNQMNQMNMGGQGMAQNPMMQQQIPQNMVGMVNPNANQMMQSGGAQGGNGVGVGVGVGVGGAGNNPNMGMGGMPQQGMMQQQPQQQPQQQVQFQNFQNQYQQQQQQQGMQQQGGGAGVGVGMAPNQQQQQQANMMGNFNPQMQQANRSNPDFMAAAAVAQQQQQQQQQQQRVVPGGMMAGNRNQYMNQAPNVTMSNMMGPVPSGVVGQVPPYARQQSAGGGKPGVLNTQQQFQQQQQQQQQLRHQHMMQMQGMGGGAGGGMGAGPQQAGGAVGGGGGGGMVPQQQSMNQQQTPNLVAQLQRQNMMGQQQYQPPPY
ncbi:mediator of RNA polymerase II transcription subunit 12 isoform X1 [Drosophila santomea]|uniref:mediator of RNA polymerase II transcription subunit 12 isoform X1 n=2 Tax=Drosophila santomea TaxID=129105 RepID=UPI0019543662|nr:mediator of RNA polymerase II transcription subunit 12 isoform X1 [Drosophila santomea]